jgi:hypothetical protein
LSFFVSGTETINTTAFVAPKYLLSHNIPLTCKKHSINTIVVIMGDSNGISHRHKGGTGNNSKGARSTPLDIGRHIRNDSSSQSNGNVSTDTTASSPTHVGRAHVNQQPPVLEKVLNTTPNMVAPLTRLTINCGGKASTTNNASQTTSTVV